MTRPAHASPRPERARSSAFSSSWLTLREPFDRAARSVAAQALPWQALAAHLRAQVPPDEPVCVLDLGCGTGASLREIAPRLGGRQHWRLVDHDPALLAAASARLLAWAADRGLRAARAGAGLVIEGRGLDLHAEFMRGDLVAGWDALPFAGVHLVTASALLDLVCAAWLARLAARCQACGAAVCWALDVDGRLQWTPADADDEALAQAFADHQRRDKGFGAALGATAAQHAATVLAASGYAVAQARSDWQVDGARAAGREHGGAGEAAGDDGALLRSLLNGMAAAATEQVPAEAARWRAWHTRRSAGLASLRLRLGHVDTLAWLAPRAR